MSTYIIYKIEEIQSFGQYYLFLLNYLLYMGIYRLSITCKYDHGYSQTLKHTIIKYVTTHPIGKYITYIIQIIPNWYKCHRI